MEEWINDTLNECEGLEIPGALGKKEHILPLTRFGIDRHTLSVPPFY